MHVQLLKKLLCAALIAAAFVPAARAAESYSVEFRGAPQGTEEGLRGATLLGRGQREVATTAALRRLAGRDLETIRTTLQAAGYYAGKANFVLDTEREDGPPRVIFEIEPGPRFRVVSYSLAYRDEIDADRPATIAEAGVEADGAADGASLQSVQLRTLHALWDMGFPAAQIVSRRALADMEAGQARAVFVFETGPRARFGALRAEGADVTDTVFLEKMATWKEDEIFERSRLVSYRDRLVGTGLFTSVDVAPGAPDEDGTAPVLLTVQERKRRTIGVGGSFSTSEGPGARLFFEYRNLFHRGERARVEMDGSLVRQGLNFNLNKPLPIFRGSVFGGLTFDNETTDAFDARSVGVAAGVSRRWLSNRLETRGGLAFETSKVRNDETESRNYFISSPLSATWNTENDVLNPVRGVRTVLSVTPYTGSDSFTVSELSARTRFNFGDDDRFTLAVRGRLGSIVGTSLEDLASNKRFYAGGGSSVRGYDFQAAGPLDAEERPIGGRSVIEGAFEARAMVTDSIQAAAFIDAGSIAASSWPDFTGDFFMGAGVGARYMTAVGPIRLDVAFPLDKRESDRIVQVYVSIGQPF